MIRTLRVTVLADNSIYVPGLVSEHGLSMLIEADRYRFLFDTGQGDVFLQNARTLGCTLGSLDAIVISHGHFDHTGGLEHALHQGGQPRVFLHPAALSRRFSGGDTAPVRSIGIPPKPLKAIEAIPDRLVWTRSSTEIAPGVWCTGEIPRVAPPDIDNGRFFLDDECREPDLLPDDQALFIETAKGVVVLAGCTHAGVANTLDFITRLTGRNEVFAVIGGLHLKGAPPSAWDAAADALDQRNVRLVAPCHCTGPDAWSHLYSRFGARVQQTGAGSRFTLE